PSKVAAGSYNATLRISTPNAVPPSTTVTIRVQADSALPPKLEVSRQRLSFSFGKGAAAANQPVSVTNSGGGSLSAVIAPSTTSGGGWLNASPATSTIDATTPLKVDVTADPTGLDVGTYLGTLTVTSSSTG